MLSSFLSLLSTTRRRNYYIIATKMSTTNTPTPSVSTASPDSYSSLSSGEGEKLMTLDELFRPLCETYVSNVEKMVKKFKNDQEALALEHKHFREEIKTESEYLDGVSRALDQCRDTIAADAAGEAKAVQSNGSE